MRTRGVPLAHRIARAIREFEGEDVPVGTLDIGLYRDDLTERGASVNIQPSDLPEIAGKRVVLIDDVLYTGRTVRAALDALIDYGRPRPHPARRARRPRPPRAADPRRLRRQEHPDVARRRRAACGSRRPTARSTCASPPPRKPRCSDDHRSPARRDAARRSPAPAGRRESRGAAATCSTSTTSPSTSSSW